MRTRCKFVCRTVKHHSAGITVMLSAVTDAEKAIAEDEEFTRYTPYGELMFTVQNPVVLPMFEEGKTYYVDVTSIDTTAVNLDAGKPSDRLEAAADVANERADRIVDAVPVYAEPEKAYGQGIDPQTPLPNADDKNYLSGRSFGDDLSDMAKAAARAKQAGEDDA